MFVILKTETSIKVAFKSLDMKKTGLLSVCIIYSVLSLFGVQANHKLNFVNQPNGYKLLSFLSGDETFHFRTTEDQYVLLQDSVGYFNYAIRNANGELISSKVTAHNLKDRGTAEAEFLKTTQPNLQFGPKIKQYVQSELSLRKSNFAKIRSKKLPAVASPHYLILLVNFSDVSFLASNDSARFVNQLNADNYNTNGATGSARKYFIDNSMGSFSPTFDVYGPVTLTHSMAHYGANDANGKDIDRHGMISEAAQLIDNKVDFSKYDSNGDGLIDDVFVLFAGYSEGDGGAGTADAIWPTSGHISGHIMLDGKELDTYGCASELSGSGIIDGIGTMCHEFSHVIGLPDFYDVDHATNGTFYGTQEWDLMGGGNYNNESKTPPYYTAIERELMGWGAATLLSNGNFALNSIGTNQFYRINTATADEYYLFENRQLTGWDSFLPGHGMMVYHVDRSAPYLSRWDANSLNNYSNHPCMAIIPSGGDLSSGKESSMPYPGASAVSRINDASNPNLQSWAGVNLGKAIINVAEVGSQVTFTMLNRTDLLSVAANAASNIGNTYFTANWATNNSTTTLLNVYQQTAKIAAPTQDFTTCPPAAPWSSSSVKSSSSTFPTNSARFYNDNAYLISGQYADAINNISFSVRTYAWGTGCTSTLDLLASTDKNTWELLKTISSTENITVINTPVDAAKSYRYFKMGFHKVDLDICVDDINVNYGGVKTYALANQNVGSATSFLVSGLNSGQIYYYTLSGSNTNEAATSNDIQVQLDTVTGVSSSLQNKKYMVTATHNLRISVVSSEDCVVKIYDGIGELIKIAQLKSGINQLSIDKPGIYLVKINDFVKKLVVR